MTDYPYYPETLPATPLISAYKESRQNSIEEFKVDVGEPMTSLRATLAYDDVQCQLPMIDPDQYQTFLAWFSEDLAEGTIPFYWTHPITGATHIFKFKSPANVEFVTHRLIRLSFTLVRLGATLEI